jgi:GAF domain-containing protein/HAMP domain-containing protein
MTIKPAKRRLDLGSLRVRLIVSYMLIAIFSFSLMGIYGSYRAQQSNNYLTKQLEQNVYQQARDNLESATEFQAAELNNFYTGIKKDIIQVGNTLANMLSDEIVLGADSYWDASTALTRLPNGSWDNDNAETASIFIPASVEPATDLILEINAARKLDFLVPPLLDANPDVVALYFGGKQGETIYYPNIDLAAIVPNDFDVTQRPWYLAAAPAMNPQKQAVWSDPYLDAALNGLVITSSFPVYDQTGNFRGVTAMDIQLTRITDIVSSIQIGQTGYAFLLDEESRIIALPEAGYQDLGISPEMLPLGEILEAQNLSPAIPQEFWNTISSMTAGESGFRTVTINGVERFIAYKSIGEVNYSIAIVVPSEELLASAIAANEQISRVARTAVLIGIFLSIGVLIVTLVLTLQIGNRLTRPLIGLTQIAEEIERGNLNAIAKIEGRGELATLAHTFNSMTAQLRDTIGNLEKRVADRTRALERRTEQMRAALEVGSAAVSVRDLEELLMRTTYLISQRFGFYHVGIFLLDERQEYAVLRASNSKGGQAMLARGHRLRVGQEGIVGFVTSSGQPRIALSVGEDKVYFQNPDLPQTRSEATIPMIASGQVIGALDVQSTDEAAFEEEDLITLRVLADQIAIAIENARLLTESQKSIEAAQRAYGEISRTSWQAIFEEKLRPLGYSALPKGNIVPVSAEKPSPEHVQAIQAGQAVLSEDEKVLYAPIKVLGNPIGVIRLKQKDDARWTSQNIAIINSLADQLGAALESARLYEQIRDRARRESMVAEITSQIGSSVELETILQTTAREIGRIFSGSEVVLQFKDEEHPRRLNKTQEESNA